MAEAQALVLQLLDGQNPDGGWSYKTGPSWAEPTALSVLALQSHRDGSLGSQLNRGISWLVAQQKSSGGWSPNPSVSECTCITSLAALALLTSSPSSCDKGLEWTAGQVYRDDFSVSLMLAKALHIPPPHAPGSVAWYPGTAGWVAPTAFAAIVLSRAARARSRSDFAALAANSCSYLLGRRCLDNGWNHGGSKTRSEDATSYPETTGLALLALRVSQVPAPEESIMLAKRFANSPQSSEGLSWIQLALDMPDPLSPPAPRNNRDKALRLLAVSAREGRNTLLSA